VCNTIVPSSSSSDSSSDAVPFHRKGTTKPGGTRETDQEKKWAKEKLTKHPCIPEKKRKRKKTQLTRVTMISNPNQKNHSPVLASLRIQCYFLSLAHLLVIVNQ
jgi:hypothetical protein